jgi:hypothetical protein
LAQSIAISNCCTFLLPEIKMRPSRFASVFSLQVVVDVNTTWFAELLYSFFFQPISLDFWSLTMVHIKEL